MLRHPTFSPVSTMTMLSPFLTTNTAGNTGLSAVEVGPNLSRASQRRSPPCSSECSLFPRSGRLLSAKNNISHNLHHPHHHHHRHNNNNSSNININSNINISITPIGTSNQNSNNGPHLEPQCDVLKNFMTCRESVQIAKKCLDRLKDDFCESRHAFRECEHALETITLQATAFQQYGEGSANVDSPASVNRQQFYQHKFHALRDHLTLLEGRIDSADKRYQYAQVRLKELTGETAAFLGVRNEEALNTLITIIEAPLRSAMDAQTEAVTCPLCIDRPYTHVLCCCGKPVCSSCLERLRQHVCPYCRQENPTVREIRL